MSLALFSRLAQGTYGQAPLADVVANHAKNWRRTSNTMGGFLSGSFSLSEDNVASASLAEFYNANIGCRLVETTYGIVTWEGYIVSMQLQQEGKTFEQTLDPRYFTNKVKVRYQSDIGQSAEIAWSENTDSSDIFGESCTILSLTGATTAGATAYQATALLDMAWPRSRQVSGDARARSGRKQAGETRLRVTVAGYWSTLNLRYRETTIAAAAANTQVSTVVALSEFVTAGRIETNALSVRVDAFPQAKRLGDIIREITEQGGTGGQVWQCGVYAGRKLVYEPAPTDWTYQMREDELFDRAGIPACLEMVKPGFLLYNANAPTGWARPGTASAWDNPKIAYVEEIEFVAGKEEDQLRMRYRNAPRGTEVVARQIAGGNI